LLDVLSRNRDLDNIEISPITLVADTQNPTPIDQSAALAIGALLDDPEVPPCDLNISLQEQLEDIRTAAAEREQTVSQTRAMSAIAAALIPLVALAAFALGSYTYGVIERARLQARIVREETISKRLAKDNADYESSKSNFAAFRSLLDNLIGLRQRQPATEQLLRDLNQRWPHDPSWFISEINVKGQSVEIKGKTRNEQAVTTFAKSLEFSDGLFTGILAKNNLQGASPNASAATQPPASNIIEFTVNATYTPLAGPSKPQSDSSGAQTQQTAAPQVPKAIPLISPPQAPRVPDNPPTLNAPAASPQLGASR
jgi:Tfp pilus assembly protein PilN